MNPLRLIRTSTFQLAWWYMGIFGSSAMILVGYIYWETNGYLEQQTNATISAEIRGLTEQFRQTGGPGVEAVIRDRIARDPARSTLYLLVTADQRPVLGNLAGMACRRAGCQRLVPLYATRPGRPDHTFPGTGTAGR